MGEKCGAGGGRGRNMWSVCLANTITAQQLPQLQKSVNLFPENCFQNYSSGIEGKIRINIKLYTFCKWDCFHITNVRC